MFIQIALPDDFALLLKENWGDLEQKMLEMLVIKAYREGTISAGKVRELLDMSTRLEVDSFLKAKGVDLHYDLADFQIDRSTHQQLRQSGKLNKS